MNKPPPHHTLYDSARLEQEIASRAGGWPFRCPYTDTLATADQTQVEHIVAIEEAWLTGARDWSLSQWRAFANDPLNITLVLAHVNESKGDRNEAVWLPDKNRCWYVLRRREVRLRYGLVLEEKAQKVVNWLLQRADCRGL